MPHHQAASLFDQCCPPPLVSSSCSHHYGEACSSSSDGIVGIPRAGTLPKQSRMMPPFGGGGHLCPPRPSSAEADNSNGRHQMRECVTLRPEQFNLPSALAKSFGIRGISNYNYIICVDLRTEWPMSAQPNWPATGRSI